MKLQENERQRKPFCGEFCNFCSQTFALFSIENKKGCNKVAIILSGVQFVSEIRQIIGVISNRTRVVQITRMTFRLNIHGKISRL